MADQISEKDVESLGEKLEQFGQTLTEGEHAALVEILERAEAAQGDVQGFIRKPATRQKPTSLSRLVLHAFHTVR
jgi:hypothetical protein